MVLRHLQ